MSTNFYFQKIDEPDVQIHIGKATHVMGDYGITTFNGEKFHSLEELKNFIDSIDEVTDYRIVNEYGGDVAKDHFIATYIDGRNPLLSAFNVGGLQSRADSPRISVGYDSTSEDKYWVDKDTMALFYNGEFF